MNHERFDLPAQRRNGSGVLPVVAAVESARFLRDQLELLPAATPGERERLRQELGLLRQWLRTAEAETSGYRAVVEGLAGFAATADTLLSQAETSRPDGTVPAVPA